MNTSLKTIRFYLRANLTQKGLFGVTIFLWLSGMIMGKLLVPLMIARAFDILISSPNIAGLTLGSFSHEIIIFVGLALVSQLFMDIALYTLSRMETKVTPKLYQRVYDHLLSQSMNFHANTFSGSLVTQSNRFVNAYTSITDAFIINILQIFVLTLLSAVVIAFYSPLLAIILFLWTVAFVSLNIYLTRKRMQLSRIAAEAESTLTGYLADTLSNTGVIKAFGRGKAESKSYSRLAIDRADKRYATWMRAIKNDFFFGLLMTSLQVFILIFSIYAVKTNLITIGTLVLVQVYVTQIISNLWGLSSLARNIEQNLSDAAEMTEILDIPIEVLDPAKPEPVRIKDGAITFADVDFSYEDDEENKLFAGLNLSIAPGEKVGLIGHSGGGKTSITKLLLRYMDIQHGTISIDGQDITHITQDDLRNHIAYVPQEPLLFHRSLLENIHYGQPDASETEVVTMAKMAHAHEFIKGLPEGYDTLVGERGVKLSGGQRQRIAIARAMIKNAPILLLDEATSALDSESEALIQDALWKLMEGRTAIVIAHRLSTIQKMDRIIVMDNGQITEQGTHKELIAKKGIYANLWAHQSGGFIDE